MGALPQCLLSFVLLASVESFDSAEALYVDWQRAAEWQQQGSIRAAVLAGLPGLAAAAVPCCRTQAAQTYHRVGQSDCTHL